MKYFCCIIVCGNKLTISHLLTLIEGEVNLLCYYQSSFNKNLLLVTLLQNEFVWDVIGFTFSCLFSWKVRGAVFLSFRQLSSNKNLSVVTLLLNNCVCEV